jgi:hypothetical protein
MTELRTFAFCPPALADRPPWLHSRLKESA